MSDKVYIETTIVSYLAARPSRDLIVAGHQQLTNDWWTTHRPDFDLFTSQFAYTEAAAGDASQAQKRLELLGETTLLATTEAALNLALSLISMGLFQSNFRKMHPTSLSPPSMAWTTSSLGIANTSPMPKYRRRCSRSAAMQVMRYLLSVRPKS